MVDQPARSADSHQTRRSWPSARMASMMWVRMVATSSEDSVRSWAATVRRKETLLVPSGKGAPVYWRRNSIDARSPAAKAASFFWMSPTSSRGPASTDKSKALDGKRRMGA